MAFIVLNPSALISGTLRESAASGTNNIYQQGMGPTGSAPGSKADATGTGTPSELWWSAEDANLLGHAVKDIVNEGTVPLFAASTASTAAMVAATATISAMNSLSSTMSGNLDLSSSKLTTLSGVVGNWTGTAAYLGPAGVNASATLTGTVSASLAYIYRIASSTQGSNVALQGQADALSLLVNSGSPNLSSSVWGDGTPPWPTGISGTLSDLSTTFYAFDIPNFSSSAGAVTQIAYMFLGTSSFAAISSGLATGSHPTGTFNNLREDFYSLTSSYKVTSGNLESSASKWNAVSSSYTTLSGNFVSLSSSYYPMSQAFAALSNSEVGTAYLTSSHWAPAGGVSYISGGLFLTGTNDVAVKSLQITSSKGEIYAWTGPGNSQFYAFQSGNNIASGSVQLTAEPDFAALALLAVSGYYTTIQVNAASDYNRMVMMSGTQTAHLMLSQAGLRLSSTFGPLKLNRGLEVTGTNTLSGTTTITGTVEVSGGVNITGTWASSSHVFENGALNVSGGYDGIHVQVRNNPGSTFFEGWSQGNLVLALSSSGDIATSGALSAALGATMGGSKIVNLGAGTATGDAVNYDQFNGVSSSLNSSATLWNNASASISGVITSASLSVTPDALYIKDGGNKIWKITIDLTGTISTSAA